MEPSRTMLVQDEEKNSMLPLERGILARDFYGKSQDVVSQLGKINRPRLMRSLRQFGYCLTPTLIRARVFGERGPPLRLHPTSWLDGLRGIGCLIVFNTHFLFAFSDITIKSWGADGRPPSFIELPIIRWTYASGLGVTIFFLVAGYVCSLKAFQLMGRNDASSREKLFASLSSASFKRFFRLYIPAITSTFFVAMCAHIGIYDLARPYIESKEYFPGVSREPQMPRFASLFEQIQFWLSEMNTMMSVWQFKPFYPTHDHHLWTIREQFRSSMYLYIALLALSPTREVVRLAFLVILDCYFIWWGRWEIALFFWGATVAQVDVWRARGKAAENPASEKANPAIDLSMAPPNLGMARWVSPSAIRRHTTRMFRDCVWFACFIMALYFMSAPRKGYLTAPGYTFLTESIPSFYAHKETLLPSLGVTLLIICLTTCSTTSRCYRLLTKEPVQYLGKVSFALYLVHGPYLHMCGYMMPHLIWHFIGQNSPSHWTLGLFFGWLINLVIVLWIADVYTREVDKRTVKVINWLVGYCFVKPG